MRGGRGKTSQHWICQDCCARWERHPLEEYQKNWTGDPDHLDLVAFGTLCGLFFKDAYKNSAFCQYDRDTKEYGHPVDKGCIRFVDYCNMMDAGAGPGIVVKSSPRSGRSSSSSRRRNVSFSTNSTRTDSRGRTRPREEFSMTSDGDTRMVEEAEYGYNVLEQY